MEDERVYHAGSGCQAASLPLTPRHLHDLKKACSVEGKKTGGFASQETAPLSHSAGMEALSRLKGGRVIQLVLVHHGENVGWEADEVPCRSFSDFLPPTWTCAFQRIPLSSIPLSPCIHGFPVHHLA